MPPEADAPAPVLGTDPAANPAPAPAADPAKPADPVLGADPAKTPDPAADPAKTPDPAKPTEPVVPEKYEFKAPDGVTLDEGVIGAFSEVAKGLKLTQEQAQALVDFQVSRDTQTAKAQGEAYAKMTTDWAAQTQRLPELGGANFEASRALAQKAVDTLGGPELNQALREFGWGNHPAIFRAFAAAGKLMAEANIHQGAGPSSTPIDVGKALFPKSSGGS